VAEAAAGSREAFDELVRRHQGRVYRLVRTLVGDAAEAEDLAQEAFVRAFRSIGRFRGDAAFATWLHRLAVNVVHDHRVRQARRWWLWTATPIDPAAPVDETLARRQLIERALASLPEDLRVAVTLRDLEGLDYREIASVLGVPIGTVESRIFRARQRLRPLLAPLVAEAELWRKAR
jgi:RNA polymerase sigma-70 factor (ECF subfamily)